MIHFQPLTSKDSEPALVKHQTSNTRYFQVSPVWTVPHRGKEMSFLLRLSSKDSWGHRELERDERPGRCWTGDTFPHPKEKGPGDAVVSPSSLGSPSDPYPGQLHQQTSHPGSCAPTAQYSLFCKLHCSHTPTERSSRHRRRQHRARQERGTACATPWGNRCSDPDTVRPETRASRLCLSAMGISTRRLPSDRVTACVLHLPNHGAPVSRESESSFLSAVVSLQGNLLYLKMFFSFVPMWKA